MNAIQPNSKLKEFFLIVKSGVTGALALTGICIILFLIGFAYRGQFISHLYQQTFARCSLEGLFITTSSLGFILGIIARRRLTLKNEIILIAVFSVPLIIGAWFLHTVATHFSLPQSMKLMDCTNSEINIRLKAPKGHGYKFELLTPGALTTTPNGSKISSYKLSGHIRISSGPSLIADLSLTPDKVEFIDSGFILAGVDSQNTTVTLDQFLQPQKDYDIKIIFNPPPPPSSSIWLYWLQSRRDTER
jgi:hypothetical protein